MEEPAIRTSSRPSAIIVVVKDESSVALSADENLLCRTCDEKIVEEAKSLLKSGDEWMMLLEVWEKWLKEERDKEGDDGEEPKQIDAMKSGQSESGGNQEEVVVLEASGADVRSDEKNQDDASTVPVEATSVTRDVDSEISVREVQLDGEIKVQERNEVAKDERERKEREAASEREALRREEASRRDQEEKKRVAYLAELEGNMSVSDAKAKIIRFEQIIEEFTKHINNLLNRSGMMSEDVCETLVSGDDGNHASAYSFAVAVSGFILNLNYRTVMFVLARYVKIYLSPHLSSSPLIHFNPFCV
tara:strand:+ start:719 stop:1630 length:912 start_codon:yes stop_codon:yes gene_type:complete